MNSTFNIMGIDPGSRNVGVSIYNLNADLSINRVTTHNLNIDIENDNGIHENILDRTKKLSTIIKMLYAIYTPSIVAMESSFINTSRMGAVIPLTKSIHTIESSIYEIDSYAKILSIPPGVIKKIFGSKQIGKDAVSVALDKNLELVSKVVDRKNITEHEIDAIAIAYTLLEYIKTTGGMICIRYLSV